MAVILIGFIGLGALSLQYSESVQETGNNTVIENESWTADIGNITTLTQSNRQNAVYDDTVTVRDNTSTILESSGNYTWFSRNGTIRADGGELSQGENANITYNWSQPTTTQNTNRAVVVNLFSAILQPWVILLAFVFFVAVFLGFGDPV